MCVVVWIDEFCCDELFECGCVGCIVCILLDGWFVGCYVEMCEGCEDVVGCIGDCVWVVEIFDVDELCVVVCVGVELVCECVD